VSCIPSGAVWSQTQGHTSCCIHNKAPEDNAEKRRRTWSWIAASLVNAAAAGDEQISVKDVDTQTNQTNASVSASKLRPAQRMARARRLQASQSAAIQQQVFPSEFIVAVRQRRN
jgi:hypothetical protein